MLKTPSFFYTFSKNLFTNFKFFFGEKNKIAFLKLNGRLMKGSLLALLKQIVISCVVNLRSCTVGGLIIVGFAEISVCKNVHCSLHMQDRVTPVFFPLNLDTCS
jgi:hypothetical protein